MSCITAEQLKKNMQEARRIRHVLITPARGRLIDAAIKSGISKKKLCLMYQLNYEDIRAIQKGTYVYQTV